MGLELFLQIQKILGDRVVLKGGAATQFYLPIEAQRTSVDIDMLFFGMEAEINETLEQITELLGSGDGLFEFRKHIPKKPKTTLPLNTYYVDIPSVLSAEERRVQKDETPHQELKIEFIMHEEALEYQKKTGENIFAVNSICEYQILPLNTLFADVREQLLRYEMADSGEDVVLKKSIRDFNSLYLNSKVDYSPQNVACGAALIRLMYELILKDSGWELVDKALKIEKMLTLEKYSGKEKGQKIKTVRELLIKEFASYSAISPQVLKGKNLKRVFWAVADVDNLSEIEHVIKTI